MPEGKDSILEEEQDESQRPWGHYEVLLDTDKCKVKLIHVNPNSRLSLQKHLKRSEHWYIIEGELIVEKNLSGRPLGGGAIPKKIGESIDIPQGFWHRVSNITDTPAKFIEVQTGDYFGEDDIIRKEDDYGRV